MFDDYLRTRRIYGPLDYEIHGSIKRNIDVLLATLSVANAGVQNYGLGSMSRTWRNYIYDLSSNDKEKLLTVILERFIDDYGGDAEIGFQKSGPPGIEGEPARQECLYWRSCGDPLIEPPDDVEKALLNAPVKFGLVAQGHVPTIDRMIAEGKDWPEIGAAIGWEPDTAMRHYLKLCEKPYRIAKAIESTGWGLSEDTQWIQERYEALKDRFDFTEARTNALRDFILKVMYQ